MKAAFDAKAINIYNEEDFVKEFKDVYNLSTDNKIISFQKNDPPEPDFILTFEDDSTAYLEVTQVYKYKNDIAPHNHRLIRFCAELQDRLDERLPSDYGKIVINVSAHYNQLPSPNKQNWALLLNNCEDVVLQDSKTITKHYLEDSMPTSFEVFNGISLHYMPNSLRSILVIPNMYGTHWEKDRVENLYFRIDHKNSKKYELLKSDRVWLLVRDGEGFQTIRNSLETSDYGVVSDKFERVFLQEEYDPRTHLYPYVELVVKLKKTPVPTNERTYL